MEWQIILALALAIPVILIPIALLWYINVSGTYEVIRDARKRRKRRAELLREAEALILGVVPVATVPEENATEFWVNKIPCWEMSHCPSEIRNECPAYANRAMPCWEVEGTYCKLDDYGATGTDTSICEICRVYKRWGKGEPIEIKLFDRGINTSLKAVEKLEAAVK